MVQDTHFKKALVFVGCLSLTAFTFNCGDENNQDPTKQLGIDVAQSELQRNLSPQVATEDYEELTYENSVFAFNLYQELLTTEPSNLFYSPHSISLALAMTFGGARNNTETQMEDVLAFTLGQEAIHPAFNKLDLELISRGENVDTDQDGIEPFKLKIANALWGRLGSHFEQDYLDLMAVNYGAGINMLDFANAPEESRDTINEWVALSTEDKIKDLIPLNLINGNTRLVLTNAIYFKASWDSGFEENLTTQADFTKLDGNKVQVDMMHQNEESFLYMEADNYKAIELPYQGNEMSMLVVLPDAGAFATVEQQLDADFIDDIVESLEIEAVELSFPKFETESKFSLAEILINMGMDDAFTLGVADFSGITGDLSTFIGDVIHQSFVSVNEKGTEAAAATAVLMFDSAMPGDPATFNANRPFIFCIRDNATKAILFIGRIVDPIE